MNMIDSQKLDAMHDDKFLNDLWHDYTTNGKLELLAQAMGWPVLEKSYDEWLAEFTANENEIENEPVDDLNPETHE
jgi:hypothetical protein